MGEGVADAPSSENSLESDFNHLNSEAKLVSTEHPATNLNVYGNGMCPEPTAAVQRNEEMLRYYEEVSVPYSCQSSSPPTPPSRRAVAPRRKRPERAVYVPPSRSQPLNPSAPPYVSPTTSPTRLDSAVSSHPLNPLASPWVSPPTSPCHTSPSSPTRLSSREPSKCRGKKPDRGVYVPPRGRGKQLQSSSGRGPEVRNSTSPTTHIDPSPSPVSPPCTSPLPAEGEDVTDQVVREITTAVGGVQIESPEIDYLAFQTSDSTINIDQFGHVIELYDFSGHLTTPDIMSAFPSFNSR